ncbi:MAG: tyrosine-type recombinase/integrase [Bryobacterales bacterium]|nr:tyrosine-type recombinase/integrase [Bryobacterales bacterium]
MKPKTRPLEQVFAAQIQTLAPTLRPSTLRNYRCATRRFLDHLHHAFPDLRHLNQLRRDPHLLAWFASLWQPHSTSHAPLSNSTRRQHLICIRRLLDLLSSNGRPLAADLIHRDDFPPLPRYLPRPLSHTDDQQLQQQLRNHEDLPQLALQLMRATGIRIGECIDLSVDCLRQIGPQRWVLHVPLGKLHSERLVPADAELRAIVARMLTLRARKLAGSSQADDCLLPRPLATHHSWYRTLRGALRQAAHSAGCSAPVQPHHLRHTFATEMLRLGVSLPALMQMLGHKDIRMTLRYAQVTQEDLQREFYRARGNTIQPHRVPELLGSTALCAGIAGVCQALTSARHLLEMFRRERADEQQRRKLHRLNRRLAGILKQLGRFVTDEK